MTIEETPIKLILDEVINCVCTNNNIGGMYHTNGSLTFYESYVEQIVPPINTCGITISYMKFLKSAKLLTVKIDGGYLISPDFKIEISEPGSIERFSKECLKYIKNSREITDILK